MTNVPEWMFRLAKREDVPAILALLADDFIGCSREAGRSESIDAAFDAIERDPNNALYIAEEGGEIVACAQMTLIPGLSRKGMKRALIESVRVASNHRGRGIGHWLFAQLEAVARAEGCGMIQLSTDKRRAEAHRFYQSLGYVASHEAFKRMLLE